MSPSSRTLNPLHFEDLEPHRFEDLVRQLAYRYRPWRYLEATGRQGADQGVDIRGVEMVTEPSGLGLEVEEDESEERTEEPLARPVVEERHWRIQCKRYRRIGPKLIREIVAATIPDPEQAPYGLIVAAACDVSAETLAAFRQEAHACGVVESHLWTKAHLEDLLFLPENDHLLFAYFGISLGIRRRSELQRIRGSIILKRKLLRAFGQSSIRETLLQDVLIRDIANDDYPDEERVPGYSEMRCPPWHVGIAEYFVVSGLLIWRFGYDGWVKEDRGWDILEESVKVPPGTMGQGHRLDRGEAEESIEEQERQRSLSRLHQRVPESERATIRELWLLPFAHILEVDAIGDAAYEGPHLYCRFDGDEGPYVERVAFLAAGRWIGETLALDPKDRKPLFAALRDAPSGSVSSDDSARS
jgi:hypothetical protein